MANDVKTIAQHKLAVTVRACRDAATAKAANAVRKEK
jgi:hypothetical protein